MKNVGKLLFLGFLILFSPPSNSRNFQEREKITITDPVRTNTNVAVLQIDPSPRFTFSWNGTLRIRKTDKAVMYEYKPKKPDKPYRHLITFLELLQKETQKKLPRVDVTVVTQREFLNLVEVRGFVWTEPLIEESAKSRESGLLWFTEGDVFSVFIVKLKDPARVLLLEKFLTHLLLMQEWELGVRNVSPEDTEVLVDKRKEEWKKREGRAYAMFGRISGNWHLLQLDWPPTPAPPWLRY